MGITIEEEKGEERCGLELESERWQRERREASWGSVNATTLGLHEWLWGIVEGWPNFLGGLGGSGSLLASRRYANYDVHPRPPLP